MVTRLHARKGTSDLSLIDKDVDIIGGCETQYFSEYLEKIGFRTNSSYLFNVASDPYQEMLKQDSHYKTSPSRIVVLSQIQRLAYAYIDIEFNKNQKIKSLSSFINNAISELEFCINELRKHKKCDIYILSPINYYSPSLGYFDYISIKYWSKYEFTLHYKIKLYNLARKYPNLYVLDSDVMLEREGKIPFHDKENIRLYETKGGHFERTGAEIFSEEFIYQLFINSKRVKRIKCVVLDIDNTLWNGIYREDGPDNIKPVHFFKIYNLITLYQRGILIALCSKNDESDKEGIFKLLDKLYKNTLARDFVSKILSSRINWLPKSQNILSISKEINIGVDSIAFFDDNQFEREEVSTNLPSVQVFSDKDLFIAPELPCFQPYGALSEEALSRNEKYAQDVIRKQEESKFSGDKFTHFLFQSGMIIRFHEAERFELTRVSEILQRTNQMNATLKRMDEQDVLNFYENNHILVMYLRDNFGDYGLIGACLYLISNSCLSIVEFALSCRAMGRKIEDAFIEEIIGIANDHSCSSINIKISVTERNNNFINCLKSHDFSQDLSIDTNSNLNVLQLDLATKKGRAFAEWFTIEQ